MKSLQAPEHLRRAGSQVHPADDVVHPVIIHGGILQKLIHHLLHIQNTLGEIRPCSHSGKRRRLTPDGRNCAGLRAGIPLGRQYFFSGKRSPIQGNFNSLPLSFPVKYSRNPVSRHFFRQGFRHRLRTGKGDIPQLDHDVIFLEPGLGGGAVRHHFGHQHSGESAKLQLRNERLRHRARNNSQSGRFGRGERLHLMRVRRQRRRLKVVRTSCGPVNGISGARTYQQSQCQKDTGFHIHVR